MTRRPGEGGSVLHGVKWITSKRRLTVARQEAVRAGGVEGFDSAVVAQFHHRDRAVVNEPAHVGVGIAFLLFGFLFRGC